MRVAAAGQRLKLTAERAHLVADVDGMVDEALDASRDGGLPARVWRGLTGGEVDKQLEPRVSYSEVAGEALRAPRARARSNRPPRDADVNFQTASLPAIPSQTGLKVDAQRLLARVESGAGRDRQRRARCAAT